MRFTALVATALATLCILSAAQARQRGDYSKPISQACMEQIKKLSSAAGGNCCATADGWEAKEAVWDIKRGKYVVTIAGHEYVLDDNVVLTTPNCSGMAIVWYYFKTINEGGKMTTEHTPTFRCFWPGPGA
jgi:hypothetical protein